MHSRSLSVSHPRLNRHKNLILISVSLMRSVNYDVSRSVSCWNCFALRAIWNFLGGLGIFRTFCFVLAFSVVVGEKSLWITIRVLDRFCGKLGTMSRCFYPLTSNGDFIFHIFLQLSSWKQVLSGLFSSEIFLNFPVHLIIRWKIV